MNEYKTVRKWFWVWEFEKEEQWLNLMAQSGWLLNGVGFATYHFVSCVPGEYTVRLEMHGYDEAYIAFMEETGAQYVGRYMQWLFFVRPAALGPFNIFSDIDSKIAHLNKIGKVLASVGAANLCIGLANSFTSGASLGWINLLCATLLMYGLGRIHGRLDALKTERQLHE